IALSTLAGATQNGGALLAESRSKSVHRRIVYLTTRGHLIEKLKHQPLFEQAVELTAARQISLYPLWVAHLGEVYLLAGRLEEAHPLAERALARARDTKQLAEQMSNGGGVPMQMTLRRCKTTRMVGQCGMLSWHTLRAAR